MAFSNVRVEANSPTSTTLRWSNSGSNLVGIYRSTDGSAYTLITTPDLLAVATLSYDDSNLAAGTKYYYKLSDDGGATFSSVVTVITHVCSSAAGTDQLVDLPRLTSAEIQSQVIAKSWMTKFNELTRKLEAWILRSEVVEDDPCVACAEDGAIVFDCSEGCSHFEVDVDQVINSISFINCNNEPTVYWQCPPGSDCQISGWPSNGKFSGDEGFQAPLGAGKTMQSGRQPPRSKKGGNKRLSGGGGGGGSCECTPSRQGTLTIKCCTANCSMACGGTTSISVKVCGGKGPYTITGTGGLVFKKVDGTALTASTEFDAGATIKVTPAVNSGSGVAGVAYRRWWIEASCGSPTSFTLFNADFGCNDDYQAPIVSNGSCTDASPCPTTCPETFFDGTIAVGLSDVKCKSGTCTTGMCSNSLMGLGACPGTDAGRYGQATVTSDVRTAPMIAAGCNPCGVSSAGKVITATDSLGNSVAVTLKI